MRRPVDSPYRITTEFGVTDSHAAFGRHSGVDYSVPLNRPTYAPKAGSVVYAQMHRTGGNMIIIFDGQFYHRLMHHNSMLVSIGQRVNEGQQVGKAGTTGLSTGVHCHWDICKAQVPRSFNDFISPAEWLSGAYAPATAPTLQPYQRKVGANGVNYRKQATLTGAIIKEYPPNDVLDFKGYVRAEPYAGNNIWFVGKYTGGYAWSGAFVDTGTHDLPDMTSAPVAPPLIPPDVKPPITEPPIVVPPVPEVVYSTRPNETDAWGIDVSGHQGNIDFSELTKADIDFAIIKAGHTGPSYGGDDNRQDGKFVRNVTGFKTLGVPMGFYWYVYFDENPQTEAERFSRIVQNLEGSLWVDVEEKENANIEWLRTFKDVVESTTNRTLNLYTYWSYANEHPWLADLQMKVWMAHYSRAPGTDLSDTPLGTPVMHQYSSTGKLQGISTNVDLNVFYGSKEQFVELSTPVTEPEEPETPDEPNKDDEQDKRLGIIEDFIEKLKALFSADETK